MMTATTSLLSLTANDLMSRDLVLLPREMSLQAAARLLAESRVSGAPVVDADGRCIGVLSATNFVNMFEKEGICKCADEPVYYSAWQVVERDSQPSDRVESHMTADIVTAPLSTPIVRLARMMLDAHIHRIIIVDRSGKPIGLVSSTDILAALAHAETED
jgi:CBS-domain-containing membrane protein